MALGFVGGFAAQVCSEPPRLAREFRGAWIATVANIDWPSKKTLPAEEQKEELRRLFDKAVALNLNAVVMQVRPACDAMYASELEPWSGFLTGEMGRAPSPWYDPLEFAVEEAHKRGLQLHTWFNPYRAGHASWAGEYPANHVSNALPDAVVRYGKQLWLDPGSAEGEEHSLRVVLDVVKRYDIDGVHFDDYFYPYPITEEVGDSGSNGLDADEKPPRREVPFPDDASWDAYTARTPEAERLSRGDWRRENVNRFVRRVSEGIKATKPGVAFGVSPFGIWRPGHPSSVVGFDAYDKLYADSKLWLEEGWVDYASPQLYWPIRSRGQSYPVLLEWWSRQNPLGRPLWPGNYTSRVSDEPDGKGKWAAAELVEQVRLTQAFGAASGNIHFSMKALAKNYGGVADALLAGPYARPALPPVLESLDLPPADSSPPRVQAYGKKLVFEPRPMDLHWVVQANTDGQWVDQILTAGKPVLDLSVAGLTDADSGEFVVRSVDRYGRESEPRRFKLPLP
ncbi:MAG: family 10 glycosylhydrolase [Planctomycetota bacterium]